MAATSPRSSSYTPDLEAATERVREANERFAAVGRKVTTAYLDGVEKYVSEFTHFERRLGEQFPAEPVASMFSAHAKLTQDVTKASVSAARELITA